MDTNVIDFSFSLSELEYFLLILTRVTCFIYIAPFFGMTNTPARIKIGLGVFVSVLLYYAIVPKQYAEYDTIFGYAMIVVKEAAVGLIIGLGAQVCMSITSLAGRLIDMEIGLAMANQMDPTTQEQSTISGIYLQYFIMLILIVTGFYEYLLRAIAETFILIPVNEAVFRYDSLVDNVVTFLTGYVLVGFQICMPIFASIIVLNAVLGILAKVSPQMNMFAVGMQLKILVGLSILFLTVSLLPYSAEAVFTQMKVIIVSLVESMM